MRANKYLYIVSLDSDISVIFNGINKKFVKVNKDKIDSFVQILQSPDSFVNSHQSIIKYFHSLGLIVDNDCDEQAILKDARNRYICSKEYKTTIVPTYECNYNCWYCIQKHEPVKIDNEKIQLIIKHVKKYIIENGIEFYVLSWFGGEPLTQPEIIDFVSSELSSFCRNNRVDYSAGITTNGALLSTKNIQMLIKNNINYFQIAIDGDERTHNLNKHDSHSDNSFALILRNIVNLCTLSPNAEVVLRLNYTLATLKSGDLLNDICRYIPFEIRNRIRVDLQKIWQIQEEKVSIKELKTLQEKFVCAGFELCTEHVFSMCYVEKEHYNMFFYNGGVEKCDKRPIDQLRGYINANGDVVWKEKTTFQEYDLFDQGCICNDCLYYPLCYCGCPMLREDRINENGKVICGHGGEYSIFENRIQDYCWRVLNNEKVRKEIK